MPTHSIREFVLGKIRRAELGALLQVVLSGEADPQLGPVEAELMSGDGRLVFHRDGLLCEGPLRARYDALLRASRGPVLPDGAVPVDLQLSSGGRIRIRASPAGAEVILTTLRWIGKVQLRRTIAE